LEQGTTHKFCGNQAAGKQPADDANRCWAKMEPKDKGDPDMAWVNINRLRLRFRGGSDVWHLKLRCNRYSGLR
jgi:hypothetical protein